MLLLIASPRITETHSCLSMVTWFLIKWHAGKPQQDVPTLSTLTIVIVHLMTSYVLSPPGSY